MNRPHVFQLCISAFAAVLIAGCGGGSSSPSSQTPVPPTGPDDGTVPDPVRTLSAPNGVVTTIGDEMISLTWESVHGAETYNLYYATESIQNIGNYAAYQAGSLLLGVTPPVDVTGLDNGISHYFRITATSASEESPPSQEVVATPLIQGRYSISGNGTRIIDHITRLEWERCSVGQSWSNTTMECLGMPTRFSWADTPGENANGFRTPTIEELRTLVYCSNSGNFDSNGTNASCGTSPNYNVPTISHLFPMNLDVFWSSSWSGRTTAMCVNFKDGMTVSIGRTGTFAVRLVRPLD